MLNKSLDLRKGKGQRDEECEKQVDFANETKVRKLPKSEDLNLFGIFNVKVHE